MTAQAVATLLEWGSHTRKKYQKKFAEEFWGKNIGTYRYDESCGADGSGMINSTMVERMLKAFQEEVNAEEGV